MWVLYLMWQLFYTLLLKLFVCDNCHCPIILSLYSVLKVCVWCLCVCIQACVCIYVCVCMSVCTYACVHARVHMHVYGCACVWPSFMQKLFIQICISEFRTCLWHPPPLPHTHLSPRFTMICGATGGCLKWATNLVMILLMLSRTVHASACKCVCAHMCCVCVHACVCARVCVCVCARIYIYIYLWVPVTTVH